MAWKAGTAAEVIGTPRGSIGAKLQQAKVYLETPDLIAWTLAIILLAGFLATTILNLLSYYVAIAATKFGLDPDDHSIPVTSSVMDLLGSAVLVFVIAFFI